jgi:hypothetical protein
MRDVRQEPDVANLVAVARQLGAVWVIAPPLDGWVWYRGHWWPVEISRPEREGHAGVRSPTQERFVGVCGIHGARWLTWRSTRDVLGSLRALAAPPGTA